MRKTEYKNNAIKKACLYSIILFLTLTFHNANSQQKDNTPLDITPQEIWESGIPYIENYTPENYGAFDQNWDVIQDSSGIMYFANGDGVLSYDGANWSLLELPNKSTVFSLGISNSGKIYVGAIGELGYLEANSIGQLTYISLFSKLPKTYHDFSEIRNICVTKEGVYFTSKKYIFKWDGIKFQILKNSGDTSIFFVNNILFKRIKGKGLMELKKGKFIPVKLGEFFANDKIYAILPYNKTEYLIATKNRLYIYNGETINESKTNDSSFFLDNVIYSGVRLNDGSFAFGSLYKGILILDPKGEKKMVLSQKGLLNSNQIFKLFQDQSGILWASLQSGISKIEYPSPFTYFNEYNNTPETIYDLERFNKTLYVGGPEGLFLLKNELGINHFEKSKDNFGMVWDMQVFQDKLLVGSYLALFEINSKGESKKLFDITVSSLYHSKINPNRIYIATRSGLVSIRYENDNWIIDHRFKELHFFIDKIIETPEGDLWLGTDKNEIVGITFANQEAAFNLKQPKINIYKPKDGLPDDIGKPYLIQDKFYLSSDTKIFRFDSKTQKFIKDEQLFTQLGVNHKKVKLNFVDKKNRIGLITYNGEKRLNQMLGTPQKDSSYTLIPLNEQRIIDKKKFGVFEEFKDSIFWYKGKSGLIRHDIKKRNKTIPKKLKAIISKVIYKSDSIIFAGYTSSYTPELPYKNNQIRFQYTNPIYYDESKNQFQYKLEGFDKDWSHWSSETKKDYTNIPAGNYTFKVRSKNIFNQIGGEDSFSFIIIAPWYQSWLAYLLYGMGTIAFVVLFSKWRSQELKRKNIALEEVIKERTLEISYKSELLGKQTEKLIEMGNAKTKLYSNITHEFRTPLTVILGMADSLGLNVENKSFEGAEKSLEMIHRNGKNLLHLVNEMLDLAKSESGNMELQLIQTDVVPLVKYLSQSFHSLAEENQINLTVYSEIDELIMDLDLIKLTSILSNVLSNAIKFTTPLGKIIVHINRVVQEENESLLIKVKDNGKGIAEEELPNVFNRFYQTDVSSSRQNRGTGIGLALAKELVELMNGTIGVKSKLEKGSEFSIEIPVTRNASTTKDILTPDKPYISDSDPLPVEIDQVQVNNPELPLVLIIEDNIDVAHYLKICLKETYTTIHAVDGIQGIKLALERVPDIIICDVMMPGKDGFEVCATLKSDERTDHIPIIILTAKVTEEDRITGLSHGADAYLPKPFNKKELFVRLDQLVLLRKKLIEKIQNNGFYQFLNKSPEKPEAKFLQKIIKIIHKEMDDSNFSSGELARKLHLSESQVYRKLKAITGKSTAVFIRSIRLQKAKELITSTDKTISEIAYEVGFNDPSWFSRAFREEFGFSPSDMSK